MSSAQTAHELCRSCEAPVSGKYCSVCGERAVHDGDLRLKHLNHDFVHDLTDLDGKVWRTVLALLFQPGRLTAEYWAGRRGPWIRPLRIYLVVTALQLLLAANALGPLGMRVWVRDGPRGEPAYVVGQHAEASNKLVDAEQNHHIQDVYLWVRYLSLGLFAGCSLLLYRKRQPYYGAHLIFALHYYSFESIVSGLMVRIAPDARPFIPLAVGFVYMLFALRRIYRRGFFAAFGGAVALFISVAAIDALVLAGTVFCVATFWPHTA